MAHLEKKIKDNTVIVKCRNELCFQANSCWRYRAPESTTYDQPYAGFSMNRKGECNGFWAMEVPDKWAHFQLPEGIKK